MKIKNEKQLQAMHKIGEIVANCLEYMKASAKPGMTTLELDQLGGAFLKEHGAISAPMSCYKFPGFTCISVEKAAAHGIPGDRVLKEGDLINIDVSAHLEGYFADNGESFIIGKGNKTKTKLCKLIRKALPLALEQIQDKKKISSIGLALENLAKQEKVTIIENLGGHGVGKTLHEKPEFVPSYFDHKDKRTFEEHSCIAIEPFLSNGGTWVETSKDGWTLYLDHHYAVQKEHTIMVTKKNPVIFTTPSRSFD